MVESDFGSLSDGRAVKLYQVTNNGGASVAITDLGAIITSLKVPGSDGELADVVLGFDSAQPYLTDSPFFGAIVGRFANRIAKGRFTLDGTDHQLATNQGGNHLHGGEVGFDKRVWRGEALETAEGPGVRFSHFSEDGDQHYPGRLEVAVRYYWTDDARLIVDYHAVTDAPTILNLTQHSYFNLGGHDAGSILDHNLQINADAYTPVDTTLLPTGEIAPVGGTPIDFRAPKRIGDDIDANHPQIAIGKGFDHNMVLRERFEPGDVRLAAILVDPRSGRRMEIATDQPGAQLYTANNLGGAVPAKDGASYQARSAICFETQHFPDSPNHPHFPSTRLNPGETFESRTIFSFSADR
ncbi:MAG: aldose epimerase family protein [Geminicoccaceae bacterium]